MMEHKDLCVVLDGPQMICQVICEFYGHTANVLEAPCIERFGESNAIARQLWRSVKVIDKERP
jgi:hypothetical protein